MQFRDLKAQYAAMKDSIDAGISEVINDCNFISGRQVAQLEEKLAEYTGVKHCIACANGTDALLLALMAWEIGPGDAVFVPDFTFFSSGEVVSNVGAYPVFVDVDEDTFNISPECLEQMIVKTLEEGKAAPKVIVTVDLFGLPADYARIKEIAEKYHLKILEDAAQGFGGRIKTRMACSFGHISTTSFFPAKPLGCYGDGGAVFTDDDRLAELIASLRIHGKGKSKYDNIRIGMNSRLDTLQAAVLLAKFDAFRRTELDAVNEAAAYYTAKLKDTVAVPVVPDGFYSSWAQYTIRLINREKRDGLKNFLKEHDVPSIVYYVKPMHRQEAFFSGQYSDGDYKVTNALCESVLSLPMHPYLTREAQNKTVACIKEYLDQ